VVVLLLIPVAAGILESRADRVPLLREDEPLDEHQAGR